MPRHGLEWVLILLPLLALGCGGGSGAPQPGVLRVGQRQDFRSLDPATATDAANIAVVRLIYRSLLDFDDEVNLVPALAADMPTLGSDHKTWTIHVRPGVCFSNGREVVAEDFVYSIRRIIDPKTKSMASSYLLSIAGAKEFADGKADDIRGLRAVDRYTLEIETKEPDLTVPYLLAGVPTAAVPREEVEKAGTDFFRQPVGTGPFALAEWRRDLHLRLKRNEHYSLPDKPALDAIEFTFNLDDLTCLEMFQRGELDLLEYPSGPAYVALKNDPKWQPYVITRVYNGTWWLAFNCEMEPFTDVRVRRALSHAIDRERLLRIVNGRGTIAKGILPPDMPGYNPNLKGYDYDPDLARRLLAEAGYPNGIKEPIPFYGTSATEDRMKLTDAIADDLRRVGVETQLQVMAEQVFEGAVMKRHTAAMNFWGWAQDFPDPWDFLHMNFHGDNIQDTDSVNYFFFNDDETNRLLNEARKETDRKKRLDLYQQAEQRIMDEAPCVPIYHDIQVHAHQPWLRGDAIHPVWFTRYEKMAVVP